MKKKSSPRLKDFDYKGGYVYHLTICTHKRAEVFKDMKLIEGVLMRIRGSALKYGFTLLVYCFMPDHLHLLVHGKNGSDLKLFARHFKQLTGFDYKKKTGSKLWHLSYYDHVLRKDEDVRGVARYILDNPVRKGMVEHYLEYEFSGSDVFDISDL